MKSILLVVFITSTAFAIAEPTPGNHWLGTVGFIKGPSGDGVGLEMMSPHVLQKQFENRSGNLRFYLGIDDIITHNVAQDSAGKFRAEEYFLFSLGLKHTINYEGGGQTYWQAGYGHIEGAAFRKDPSSALILGLGYGAPLGTMKWKEHECTLLGVANFRYTMLTARSTKLAGEPDVYGGGYFSLGVMSNY
jgi:hypothetical protein